VPESQPTPPQKEWEEEEKWRDPFKKLGGWYITTKQEEVKAKGKKNKLSKL